MATKRNRKIYDDGAVMVEQTYTDDSATVASKKMRNAPMSETKTINVADILDTYAGYIPQRFGMNDGAEDGGECIICGAKTQYPLRKICVSCLEKCGREIFDKCKESIESGDRFFDIPVG